MEVQAKGARAMPARTAPEPRSQGPYQKPAEKKTMIRNIAMEIQYDGSRYSGWQRQPGQLTVQGELERVLQILCAEPIELNGTSRTDAGVHAEGQVASLVGDFAIPTENMQRAANNLLPEDISINRLWEADLGFHPRFEAKGKTYRYRILNSDLRDPFRASFCWWLDRKLDLAAMREACRFFIGEMDFGAFESAGAQNKGGTVREIYDLWIEEGLQEKGNSDEIILWVKGNGFLYNMVRIITGTLVEVGLGLKKPCQVEEIIKSCDRRLAGRTAPPQGLCLVKVHFDENECRKNECRKR